MHSLSTFLLLLAFPPVVLHAQAITGRVLEVSGGASVSGAAIRLIGAGDRPAGDAVTDSMGAFRLRATPGKYSLAVTHVAYARFTSQPIEVSAGQTVVVEIRLGRDVIPLQPLVVTARTNSRDRLAGFRERQAMNAFGKFVTREEIDRRPNTETARPFRAQRYVSSARVTARPATRSRTAWARFGCVPRRASIRWQ